MADKKYDRTKNLIPFDKMDKEKQKEISRKAGRRSAEKRRARKEMRKTVEDILGMPLKPGQMKNFEKIKNFSEIKGSNISAQEAIIYALVGKAMKGDVGAAAFLRDTVGDSPGYESGGTEPIQIIDDIPKSEEEEDGS